VRRPGKIVCVGQNYRSHLTEMKGKEVEEPTIFGKFAVTVIGDGDTIVLPPESSHVDAEAELAVVIGKAARRVSREKALDQCRGVHLRQSVKSSATAPASALFRS